MNAEEIQKLVESQINDRWDTTNPHSVQLRKALVPPTLITVVERALVNGNIQDRLTVVWLVLIEEPDLKSGYRIVATQDGSLFGLAAEGFLFDSHLVLCGWYGNFMDTFQAM